MENEVHNEFLMSIKLFRELKRGNKWRIKDYRDKTLLGQGLVQGWRKREQVIDGGQAELKKIEGSLRVGPDLGVWLSINSESAQTCLGAPQPHSLHPYFFSPFLIFDPLLSGLPQAVKQKHQTESMLTLLVLTSVVLLSAGKQNFKTLMACFCSVTNQYNDFAMI